MLLAIQICSYVMPIKHIMLEWICPYYSLITWRTTYLVNWRAVWSQYENYFKCCHWWIQHRGHVRRIFFSFCLVQCDCGVCRPGPAQSSLFLSAWENVSTGVSESALLRVPALCSPPRLCAAGRTQSSHQQSPCIISAALYPLPPSSLPKKIFQGVFSLFVDKASLFVQ